MRWVLPASVTAIDSGGWAFEAPVICMVGKARGFHVEVALGIDPQGLAPGARFLAEHLDG